MIVPVPYNEAVAEPASDAQVRQEAFAFLSRPETVWDDGLVRWTTLVQGFEFEGQRVPLCSMQGIFKPKAMSYAPLSIRTTFSQNPGDRPYEDAFDGEGSLIYKYRAAEGEHHENVGLRRALSERLPLIFLDGEAKGVYRAYFPVFVTGDEPALNSFLVDLAAGDRDSQSVGPAAASPLDRRYRSAAIAVRIHQRRFRSRVLAAYDTTCAVCRLRHHRALIDAAHILPDSMPGGVPTVPNALSLCKLHHAAFDHNLIGIRPDLTVDVRGDILKESDGPMLVHGLQELHNERLMKLPRRPELFPDPEFLEERYHQFQAGAA
ncbi:MAG: HNH endonuclease [Candidatus Dormiibacterota bacterium]